MQNAVKLGENFQSPHEKNNHQYQRNNTYGCNHVACGCETFQKVSEISAGACKECGECFSLRKKGESRNAKHEKRIDNAFGNHCSYSFGE